MDDSEEKYKETVRQAVEQLAAVKIKLEEAEEEIEQAERDLGETRS